MFLSPDQVSTAVQQNRQKTEPQESQTATPQLQFIQGNTQTHTSQTDIQEEFNWHIFSVFCAVPDSSWSCKSKSRQEDLKKTASLDRNQSPPQSQSSGMRRCVSVNRNSCWLELSHACQMLLGFAGCGECRSDQYEHFFGAHGTFLHMTFTVLYACVYVCVCGCRQDWVVRKRFRNTPIKITLTITRHIASIPQQVRAFPPVVLNCIRTQILAQTLKLYSGPVTFSLKTLFKRL